MSTPREYPILFKPEMVQAILEGRKTETRRLNGLDTINKNPDYWAVTDQRFGLGYPASEGRYYVGFGDPDDPVYVRSPYGGPGDALWVRETHALEDNRLTGHAIPAEYGDWRPVLWEEDGEETEDGWAETWTVVHYKATDPPPDLCCESPRCRVCRDDEYGPHWRPSIHLPRWACGLLLRVEEVRVERVQEIGQEGARAEGVTMPDGIPQPPGWWSYRQEFAHLWDEINGDRAPWEANPWVWVVRFAPIRDELWDGENVVSYGHGILDAFRRRRALDAAILAEYDGHQGPDLLADGQTCVAPRPRQQRHCSGYEVDTGGLGEETGRCLHKRGRCGCGRAA